MSDENIERSESGQPIYRYEEPKDFEMVVGGPEHADQLEAHIEKHLGEIDSVYHELISDKVHLDVHIIKPTPERPFYFLVTTGMSQMEMSPPEGAEDYTLSELCIALPESWQMDQSKWKDDETWYWPIRALKFLARFPHDYQSWLWWGHTVPNGNPPEAIEGTGFVGFILLTPITTSSEFHELKLADGRTVHFHSIVPLYQEEMDQKLKAGTESLFDGFDKHQVTEIVSTSRPNTQKKKKRFGFF